MAKFKWQRYGGYECSSRGDARFSAFNAIMQDGRSLEQHYQCDVKGYQPGGHNWRLGKGKPPLQPMSFIEQYEAYKDLWRRWALRNTELMDELDVKAAEYGYVLSDRFATTPINQAHALADLLNEGY